jgi:hypothetical protein
MKQIETRDLIETSTTAGKTKKGGNLKLRARR